MLRAWIVLLAVVACTDENDAMEEGSLTSTYVWEKVIDNGGRGNAMCASPLQSGRMLGMGDVWGPHETVTDGDVWLPRMAGTHGIGAIYGRACAYSIKYPGTAYVGIGTLKGGGGYFGAVVGWQLQTRSTSAGFGTSLASGSAGVTPRPTGNLIVVDYDASTTTEYIYALTNTGLQRSTDGGHGWTSIGGLPAVAAWKALVRAPDGSLYAASWSADQSSGSHVWHITMPRGSASSQELLGAPAVNNDFAVAGSVVLDAAGPYGLYSISGSTFTKVTSFFDSTTPLSSIAAAGSVVVAVTASHPSGTIKSVARSTDSGHTWQWQTHESSTDLGDGRAYWLQSGQITIMGSQWGGMQVAIDPQNPNFVAVAGKGGLWATQDGGQLWYPAGNGAGGDEVSNIRVGSGGEVWTNDTDWGGIHTTDHFQTYVRDTTPGTFSAASLSRNIGGHAYKVDPTTNSITKDGVSIASSYAKAAVGLAGDLEVGSDGYIYVALYGGGVLRGTPQ